MHKLGLGCQHSLSSHSFELVELLAEKYLLAQLVEQDLLAKLG